MAQQHNSFIIKVFINKEICGISIYYFVIFNKVVVEPQLRRPEVIFPKLAQNTRQMGANHGTKFMKEMKKPLLFGVGCPGQKEKRLFYHVDAATTLA